MASLLEQLMSQVGGSSGQFASALGADESATQGAISAALPAMLASLANNAEKPGGAEALSAALDRHDGSALDRLDGGIDHIDADDGQKIVNHMFGQKRSGMESEIAKSSGLDLGMITKLLPVLAPIVLGALSKQKKSGGMGAGDLASMLGGERKAAAGQPGLGGLLSKLDLDGDGNPMNDLAGMMGGGGAAAGGGSGGMGAMLSKMLGGLFKKR